MSLKSKKAAIEKTSGKSLQTNAAEYLKSSPLQEGQMVHIRNRFGCGRYRSNNHDVAVHHCDKKNSVPTALAILGHCPR